MQKVLLQDLGKMDYLSAWNLQEKLLKENVDSKSSFAKAGAENFELKAADSPTKNHLLLLEHPPVYTLGKSGAASNILISQEQMIERGISYYKTNRGGDITFHGPGQLVGYPILDLEKFYTDIGRYLRELEEVVIRTIADYGLTGERSKGETGVWLEPGSTGRARKICAMGVRCSRWITMHGFALNVNTDLNYFSSIIPCGINDKSVTSMAHELDSSLSMADVKHSLVGHFEEVFQVTCQVAEAEPA